MNFVRGSWWVRKSRPNRWISNPLIYLILHNFELTGNDNVRYMLTSSLRLRSSAVKRMFEQLERSTSALYPSSTSRLLCEGVRLNRWAYLRIFNESVKQKYQDRHHEEYVPLYESARKEHRSNRIGSLLEATSETERKIEQVNRELSEQRSSTRFWQTISIIISILSLLFGVISSV